MECLTRNYLALVGLFVLSGCASVPLETSFGPVAQEAESRTGHTVKWYGVTAPIQSGIEAVEDLLHGGLTLDEAAQIAVLNNARLQALYEQFGIARAELVEAGLPENPIFNGQLLFANSSSQSWELEVAQNFLSIFMIPLRRSVAKAELEWASHAVVAAVIDVATDTRRAFLHYQADGQNFELWKSWFLAEEASFEMALKLREAGVIPLSELAAAQLGYEEAKLAYSLAELDLEGSRERVNRLMGLYGTAASWRAVGKLPEPPGEPLSTLEFERRAVENSLDLAMAWADIKRTAKRSGITNVQALFPEVSAGSKFESQEPGNGGRVWEIGPILEIPIPLFNQGQAARAISRAEVRREWDIYTALAVELRSATRAAVYKVKVTREMALYERDVVLPVARHAMQQAELEYNAMLIGPVALLRMKQEEIEAGMAYIRAVLEYWLAGADLDQILLGRLIIRAPEDRPDIIGADIRQAAASDQGGH